MRFLINCLFFTILICVAPNLSYAAAFPQQSASKAKSEKVDSIVIFGKVYDRETSRELPLTTVEILRADSTLITSVKAGNEETDESGEVVYSSSNYRIRIPKTEGNYIIKVSKPGYEIKYVPYILSKLHRRDDNREAPKIYLSKEKVKTLDEFTVKASKVKFYHKGDTLVYNADAFMLPEGSMLDALVLQLPGVEIREGGQIYVNGRYVESLLLNGKDFFKKDQSVMLENIGVYAVKDVAVYEKRDEMDRILGDRGDLQKEYVMDVRLKKEYRHGTMLNAEVGGGTSSRYAGRLFALSYTDNSRIAFVGNANNINLINNLSRSSYSDNDYDQTGLTTRAGGGIDYFADNQLHSWELTGNASVKYTDFKNTTITNAINYFQNADNFDFSNVNNRAKNLMVATRHDFKLKKPKWNLNLKPSFSYNKNRRTDETVAATFNKEIQNIDENIVKSIFSGDYRHIQSALINRNLKAYEADSHGYEGQLQGSSRIKIPNSPDAVELKFTAQYKRNSLFGNTLQDICFGPAPESSLLQQRFSSNRPQYNFKIQGLGRYYFNIPFGTLNGSYEFIHTQNRKNSDIALLEAMTENGMSQFEPGAIPVPDFENSYTSKLYKNQHILKLTYYYGRMRNKGVWWITFTPKFFLERHNLLYHRADVFASPRRTFTRFNIDELTFAIQEQDNYIFDIRYSLNQTTPDLLNMVDIDNSTDPLNIFMGNPNLKNQANHNLSIQYMRFPNNKSKITHTVLMSAAYGTNSLVQGYSYDSESGVKTYRTYNVSGNYIINASYQLSYSFGKNDRFNLYNAIRGEFEGYANMIGYDADPTKQRVRNNVVRESITLRYADPRYSIGLTPNINYTHSKSEGPMPMGSNFGNCGLSIDGHASLPLNFQLKTDFNVIKRFGYIEDSMNDVNFIWNASLEYLIKKGVWRISLDAKDILNQNKGISYYVNASGRTQTLNTVLPRYLMLSLHYRFDFKPKKK